ncbi:metal-dependent hydrolase [Halomicroarcula sp. F13]|uniref:Metal-dependent hydrolase n=1 Tax=Haloarcula rubra TaxID=2487747 RepID=A0AAW4PWJ8_9EURY|nr:metal-dependent hydrolase [Halomicroarcula rubra]MBX0325413.1 metal-dependent hydrolase [Halomicroarcula rubra]
MWPWGHAAVGYLLCTLWLRARYGHRPTAGVVLPLAVGTQFPDLVDKPLGWTLGVLPSGRAGAHSLLIALPLLVVLWWHLDSRHGRTAVAGFALGYLSHLAGDGIYAVFDGEVLYLGYLLWPVTPLPPYEESAGILAHFAAAEVTPHLLLEVGLFVVATALWLVDGAPGLRVLGQWCMRQANAAASTLAGR